ncbi:pancreatic secretory granule membrane major glycoprotein GP2-like [Epinephelus moara]|uniref:pancreatic secretory granule membrane major glycoprotein GP2-like n=1 Tax=Epinephelus moara TaxID=300413 RepID=UPI00214E2BDF|nr:pancreatic secretory granule membrane major glycoprotein GP2-like [Epinephelus moara]XP_049920423.1 pancreatic secretory granule membrane major glycoprotein GP2-like [Epinephelus moara]
MLRLVLYLAALSQLTGGQQQQISTCTVTGPAVIDFSSNVGAVGDHCAYTLVSGAGLQVIGAFKERRRQDVSFLDHVILQVDGASDNVQLNQGGKVQAGDTTLSLSSTPQTENSVELSKDENTVTAKVTLSAHTITVIFDGTTAHIHMIGSPTQSQTGLCVDSSSSQDELKDDDLSSDSCGKQSTESNTDGIECSKMTQHCELLKVAPFTSCSIDPDPYFTACKDTLCNYPAVDGLGCQFLEAYVGVCRLQNDATLDDWRSQTGCSLSQSSCQNTCGGHEFCGEDISGNPACLCRGHFASKYRQADSLGDATVCGDNTASVSLAACLLAEKGIHHSDLHLNEQSCGGEFNEDSGMVTFTFKSSKSCGSLITAKENKIFYENTITTDSSTGSISRQNLVKVGFSCFYNQPEDQSMAFTIKGSDGLKQIVAGSWSYSVKMGMFSDLACTQPVDFSNGLTTDMIIYMSLDSDGLDPSIINLVIKDCWATDTADGNGQRYNLIENGCGNPDDNTVSVVPNSKGGTVVAFQMFQFKGNNDGINLNFNMKLCLKSNKSCMPSCPSKRRRRRAGRRLFEDKKPAQVSMSWT